MQIKLKSALFAVLMIFAVVALSSCDKSMDEPMATIQKTKEDSKPSSEVASSLRSESYFWVDQEYRNRVSTAFNSACGSYSNLEYYPMQIGFYAAFNATYNTSYIYVDLPTLNDLCNQSQGYQDMTLYKGYEDTPQKRREFKEDVYEFISRRGRPVVVLAETNPWGSGGETVNILTVWAVNSTYVKVSKISEENNLNNLVTLTYDQLFDKGIVAASNHGNTSNVVNTAYMYRRI